jgi:hypothetical protein
MNCIGASGLALFATLAQAGAIPSGGYFLLSNDGAGHEYWAGALSQMTRPDGAVTATVRIMVTPEKPEDLTGTFECAGRKMVTPANARIPVTVGTLEFVAMNAVCKSPQGLHPETHARKP